MKIRSRRISASIADAIAAPADDEVAGQSPCLGSCLNALSAFSALYRLDLEQYRPLDFLRLRRDVWQLDEALYRRSFDGPSDDDDAARQLVPAGDLGYSGSTFFSTPDGSYLVKSLPRRFEHEFFTHDLLDVYMARMMNCPESLLVRITDMVFSPKATLGGILGTAPTHHIIMENLLHLGGDGRDEQQDAVAETYDLKPDDYFFPERDIADGRLVPASIKDRLVDSFPDEVLVSARARAELISLLEADTALLADKSAVDYSLFLVRFPVTTDSPFSDSNATQSSWRTGIASTDGRWIYRAVVLDFFWAKNKLRAKAMTGLVGALNLVARKGPMSITAEPTEYRARFMRMVNKLVSSDDDDGAES
ncbi:putative phosphatidylinositol phosphate kinase [Ophiocordyceps camponoti-floridani]|uniref:Putative phosphatidylinositol phosphate kinase n=1 Tax=Ophiocordyceps camponoti-floridani TaxID=2030778 RepID=A0A8H4Q8W0_9HYPO|nr:putative phosphatidylinositol phosphate kinase [Ophiocordyceps camponoti-floridani]